MSEGKTNAGGEEGRGPGGPRAQSPSELKAQIEAEHEGVPFLVFRDAGGVQQILKLGNVSPLWIGRGGATDVDLNWDLEVSGLHAQLEKGGHDWTLVDEGLSRNGSFVNGERVRGRRRLLDGDMLRFGQSVVLYRYPGRPVEATIKSKDALTAATLSEGQRKVLLALCRPFKHAAAFATPATNQEIADELFLSVESVKTHLRILYEKFGVDSLPQNRKRLALVERALQSGLISERDL